MENIPPIIKPNVIRPISALFFIEKDIILFIILFTWLIN